MDFMLSDEQKMIFEYGRSLAADIGRDYWVECAEKGCFPDKMYKKVAQDGFVGVMVILGPWDAAFDPTGLLTVACVLVLAVRDLSTRVMPARIGTFQVAAWAYLGLVPAGALLMAVMGQTFVMPTPAQWLGLGGALVTGLFGYYAVVAAMRLGEVSVVAVSLKKQLVHGLQLSISTAYEGAGVASMVGTGNAH